MSAQARAWKASAELELVAQRPEPVAGPVQIDIELASPTRRKFDPDNRVKALLDLLVKNGVIEADDNSVLKKFSVSVDGEGFCGARVTIRKVPHVKPNPQ